MGIFPAAAQWSSTRCTLVPLSCSSSKLDSSLRFEFRDHVSFVLPLSAIRVSVKASVDNTAKAYVKEEGLVSNSNGAGFLPLGSKEKKDLRAYAHSLGKDINVQQVGKLGITPNVIKSISDALEAHEIVKVKVLDNCDNEQEEVISRLEGGTGGQVVGKIGRTLLLYRASLSKLESEKRRSEAQSVRSEKPRRRSKLAMSAGRSSQRSRLSS